MDSITEISRNLIAAVETEMNCAADREQRVRAHELCETFKESSPLCVQCGLHLAQLCNSPIARNFGLQLIEHCVKYRWNDLSQEEKVFIKENAMKLMASGTNHISVEHVYVKNALSKIIVEMIKREWPQHWPDLLLEFYELCKMGETQTELVLLTFLRLAEDTVTFQSVQTQRRREIHQALVSNMTDIFGLYLNLLHTHTSTFSAISESGDTLLVQQADAHCRVAQAVLETLASFVEWVPITHIMANNGVLLQTLCLLLSNQQLKLQAAECLLQIVNRKGKPEDRKPLLVLFTEAAMSAIFIAASAASNGSRDERNYVFLKRLCQVLTGIGSQLCYLWGTCDDVKQPQNFRIYLQAILEFTQHRSHVLSSYTQSLWASFFRHETISQDPELQSFIQSVADVARLKLIKVGCPSSDSPSSEFSRMDFDSDEDFNQFFPKYRAEVAETLRLATLLAPAVTYELAIQGLRQQLSEPIEIGEGIENGLCNLSSPSFLQWDALAVYLECVLGRILQNDKPKPSATCGIELLRAVLKYETQDPLILSCILSCISALFIFVTLAPEKLLANVLDKIFSALVFTLPGQTKATRSRAVKNVRRHACSSLVKICKQYPDILMSSFDYIYGFLQRLSNDAEQLSQMEKCTMLEALILLSNNFSEFGKQTSFIKGLMGPVHLSWLSQNMQIAFTTAENFMTYVGLDQVPVEPSNDDVVGINRSQIIYCIHTILAVIKRSKWPDDIDVARKGGFVQDTSSGIILHNPATNHILQLLPNLFLLIRAFNNLWLPNVQAKVSPEYLHAHDMLDTDKNNVLDMTDSPIVKQPIERMQHFLTNVHDNCYHILGSAGPSLGYRFYASPNLAEYIITLSLCNVHLIPDYRLRPIIRSFMKPFVQYCPPEFYQNVLIPVLVQLCPFMFQRLNEKWLTLQQTFESNSATAEQNPESQEVLEDQLNRQLTKEYIDLLGAVLHGRRGTISDSNDMMEEDNDHTNLQQHNDTLSELGLYVLKHEVLSSAFTRCCFRALSWNDTTSCNKSLGLCSVIVKQLIGSGMVGAEDAKGMLAFILLGLQQHGQHEGNQSSLLNLGLQVYDALRPLHPTIADVLLEIPNCSPRDIENLDDKLTQSDPKKQISDKRKKEMFKKIVVNMIGRNIGQLFMKSIHIKSLPPYPHASRNRPSSMLEDESTIGLCELFRRGNSCDSINS